jgi:DNA polymerase-3 subunit beta
MIEFTAPLSSIRAARTHAAKKDLRYYLNGVCFDLSKGKIAATDGHRLFVCNGPYITAAPSVIISNETLDAALKQFTGDYSRAKRNGDAPVRISVDGDTITIETPIGFIAGKAVEAQYPDYMRIIPQELSGEPATINPEYLADAGEALSLFHNAKKSKPYNGHVFYNGSGPCLVTGGALDVAILIMPLRVKPNPQDAVDALAAMKRPNVPNYQDTVTDREAA